jgi:hypothetical protein
LQRFKGAQCPAGKSNHTAESAQFSTEDRGMWQPSIGRLTTLRRRGKERYQQNDNIDKPASLYYAESATRTCYELALL